MRKFSQVLTRNDRREEERFIRELFEDPKTFSQTVVFILNATTTTTAKRQREEALIVFSYAARYHPDAMHNCMKEPGFECDKVTDRIVQVLVNAEDLCTTMLCLFLLNSQVAHILVRDRIPSVVDALVKLLNVSKGWSTTTSSSSTAVAANTAAITAAITSASSADGPDAVPMDCDSSPNGQSQTAIYIHAASALHNLMTHLPKLVLECHQRWSTTIYRFLFNSVDVGVLSLENDEDAIPSATRPPRTYCPWLALSTVSHADTAVDRDLLHPCDAALRLLQRLDITCLQPLLPLAQEHVVSFFATLR